MQLRMSPGAGTPCSLRRRPLEPPSSVTVTMAVSREMNGASGAAQRPGNDGDDVALESAEQGGQAGAAADGDDAETLPDDWW